MFDRIEPAEAQLRVQAGAALIDGGIGAAHDEIGLVVGDIEFVAHHLPEGRSGALAAICFADVEGGGVVGMNRDPRIQLTVVGVRIRTRCRWRGGLRVRFRSQMADADHENACALQEIPAR